MIFNGQQFQKNQYILYIFGPLCINVGRVFGCQHFVQANAVWGPIIINEIAAVVFTVSEAQIVVS